jgi:hypothetical protein
VFCFIPMDIVLFGLLIHTIIVYIRLEYRIKNGKYDNNKMIIPNTIAISTKKGNTDSNQLHKFFNGRYEMGTVQYPERNVLKKELHFE